jgi:type II restriction enzyme
VSEFDQAIRAFWAGRDLQTQRQVESGKVDAGTRGAVTGGGHLQAMQDAVANEFGDPDLIAGLEILRKGKLSLPGYYRRSKDWDLVVLYRDVLVAAIEFKSQVGSFGNNFNNRTEESIGNAVDIWRAYEDGLLGPVRPWIAFVMVIEHAPGSAKPLTRDGKTLYPPDPIFANTSYIDRYRILLRRLVRERLYDAAAFVSTERGGGIYDDPEPELSLHNLSAAIAGRVAYIKHLEL